MPSRTRGSRTIAAICAAAVGAAVAVAVVETAPAAASTRYQAVNSAAAYAKSLGYTIGIAVLDTKTGQYYHGGAAQHAFASESVVKTMIATRLLLQGRMHGKTASRAYKMITQSDDAIASSFYGSVGGDKLITWIKNHYHIAGLGSPPRRAGWWGNTHISAKGLVEFYAKIKKDKKVGPWLINAMHHATKYGSDGTYQFFGLPSATTGAAIKQGWGDDFDDWGKSADFNTTGFVNGDRYAVAILARGPVRHYGTAIGNMLTHVAKLVLPARAFPDDTPAVTRLSNAFGPVAGGEQIVVYGKNLTHVTAVWVGGVRATAVKSLSSTSLQVTTPKHAAGSVSVQVGTNHGTTSATAGRFTYVSPPTITSVAPTTGTTAGGTVVHITGKNFVRVWSVWFGGLRGTALKTLSSTSMTVVAPAHPVGTFDLRLVTSFGMSAVVSTDRFSYVAPPVAPPPPPTSPATTSPATTSPATTSPATAPPS